MASFELQDKSNSIINIEQTPRQRPSEIVNDQIEDYKQKLKMKLDDNLSSPALSQVLSGCGFGSTILTDTAKLLDSDSKLSGSGDKYN